MLVYVNTSPNYSGVLSGNELLVKLSGIMQHISGLCNYSKQKYDEFLRSCFNPSPAEYDFHGIAAKSMTSFSDNAQTPPLALLTFLVGIRDD